MKRNNTNHPITKKSRRGGIFYCLKELELQSGGLEEKLGFLAEHGS